MELVLLLFFLHRMIIKIKIKEVSIEEMSLILLIYFKLLGCEFKICSSELTLYFEKIK